MIDHTKSFYNLEQFLRSYFHLDWKEVYNWQGKKPNFEDIVLDYKATTSSQAIIELQNEIENLLNHVSEAELNSIIDDMCYYNPSFIGLTYGEWLKEILKILNDSEKNGKVLPLSSPSESNSLNYEKYIEMSQEEEDYFNYVDSYIKLGYLMGCYLNKNWKSNYNWHEKKPSLKAVINDFKDSESEILEQTIKDIERLLEFHSDEREIKELLSYMDADIDAKDTQITYKQWLEEIISVLKNSENKGKKLEIKYP